MNKLLFVVLAACLVFGSYVPANVAAKMFDLFLCGMCVVALLWMGWFWRYTRTS
jgi:hypothetical protein